MTPCTSWGPWDFPPSMTHVVAGPSQEPEWVEEKTVFRGRRTDYFSQPSSR